MKRGILIAVLMASGVSLAGAGPIEDREALMKGMAGATKKLASYAKGETAFDAAAVKPLLQTYIDDAAKIPTLFPAGSTGGESTAGPKIWEDPAGFKAAADKLGADATAALAATDQASLAKAFGAITSNCTSCHGTYRIKK